MLSVIKSILAAFIGVQSNQNRQKDFTQGKASHFVIAGIIGVAVFIALLILIVNLVLSAA
ncbi:DUF2970 domain-containing protein [Colwellia sp. RSH04]|uniref:DUF2970 domain-containing protein n=1 Tax=Colwellia sp. RSH04 TaxID=2305464 RepID=UPI000E58ACA8|nr:DUF2970 domain-containing protein [Colwellia sp. RSH04]RHW77918.1 DUF2970 domain-containing protein [Colwellia sp. RSH04]